MIWLRFVLLLLVLPCYLIAFSRSRWATMPLWLVSTCVMLTQYLMAAAQRAAFGIGSGENPMVFAGEMTKIMLIPIAVQIATTLRGWRVGGASSRSPITSF